MTTGYKFTPIRKQGAWGLWRLAIVIFRTYYFVWYDRIGRALASVAGNERADWTFGCPRVGPHVHRPGWCRPDATG
ncbi:hypothetical protein P9209_18010 [Prescottella defluvii]|nr:hypothetical protein P9209_18010 [Prescottella defluvii]